MTEKPILFNAEMVRAILDGRKTCTRRLPSKHSREAYSTYSYWASARKKMSEKEFYEKYSLYQLGDILYVRETWSEGYEEGTYIYRADDKLAGHPTFKESSKHIWRPSIHMPKEAARIWLKVTDVKVERLQDITEDGAKAEGAIDNRGFIHSPENEYDSIHTAREHFAEIWNSTIKKSDLDHYGWDANPYVWAISFERCEKPEGEVK